MALNSLSFICVFLPIVLVIYLLIPSMRVRNGLLVLAGLAFYSFGEPTFVFVMLASTVANWLLGRLVGTSAHPRPWLVVAVVANLLFLGVFKYADMFVSTVDTLLGWQLAAPSLALPLGISFFTFKALSYVIDVYRGDAQPGPYSRVLLYISFFPEVAAGPISKYRDLEQQLASRMTDVDHVASGLRRFAVGLAKKVLVSGAMATTADALFSADPSTLSAPCAWLAALAYLMQIYFDFSGYSDMAIGLGSMFGFSIAENFDHPYVSTTIKEFWRRWHISLSTWFRDYLYIPLGGNRHGKVRTCVNKVIVFFLCGLWHGANWTFVVWGLIHGVFSLLEEVLPIRRLPSVLGHVYAILVVMLSFVIFRSDTVSAALVLISRMFVGWQAGASSSTLLMAQLTPLFLTTLVVALVGALPVLPWAEARLQGSPQALRIVSTLGYIAAFVLLALCMLELSGGTFTPFIYAKF